MKLKHEASFCVLIRSANEKSPVSKPSVLRRFGQSLHKRMHSPSPKTCAAASSARPASAYASASSASGGVNVPGMALPSGSTNPTQPPALPLPLPGLGLCGRMGVHDEDEEDLSEERSEPVVKSTTVKMKTLNPIWNESFQLCAPLICLTWLTDFCETDD